MHKFLIFFFLFAIYLSAQSDRTDERFEIAGHKAFLIQPKVELPAEGKPWVWYAPTFDKRLPGGAEEWMFKKWLAEGISIAGVDVGESYGSPTGREVFQKLYLELTGNRGYSKKPVLLARSRGGLMLYSWATEYPQNVGGIAGIYPVTDFTSYPGLKRASGAYKMTPEELEKEAKELNPVERVGSLIQAKVPVFHIHGDSDKVVPHTPNSVRIKKQYDAAGAPMELEVVTELKKWLVENISSFGLCLSEKLMTYATGRIPNYAERKELESIVSLNIDREKGFQDLLLDLIQSKTFRN